MSYDPFEMLLKIAEPGTWNREGLEKTPERAAKAFDFLTSGYRMSIDDVVNGAIFDAGGNKELVIVKNITFFSNCEHHILPFLGKVHVGYIPDGKIIGLSKIPRIVDMFSRRLQIQERLTSEICDAVVNAIQPIGCGVVIEARHMCCSSRGVMKEEVSMETSALRGVLQTQPDARAEFIQLISNR